MSDLAKAITEHFGGRDVKPRTTPREAAVAASMVQPGRLTLEQQAAVAEALDAVRSAKGALGFYDAHGTLLGKVRASKVHGSGVRVFFGDEGGAHQAVLLSQAFAAVAGAKVAALKAAH